MARATITFVDSDDDGGGNGRSEFDPPAIAEATDLTRFAVSTRYPGVSEPVTTEEHQRAVAIAEAVVKWADARVEERRGEQ